MEKNLDKFFKDKLDHRSFEMKDEYWDGMEKLIEADEKGNNRWIFWASLFGVLCLISAIGYFSFSNVDNSAALTSDENNKSTVVMTKDNVNQNSSSTLNNPSFGKKDNVEKIENSDTNTSNSNFSENLSSDMKDKNEKRDELKTNSNSITDEIKLSSNNKADLESNNIISNTSNSVSKNNKSTPSTLEKSLIDLNLNSKAKVDNSGNKLNVDKTNSTIEKIESKKPIPNTKKPIAKSEIENIKEAKMFLLPSLNSLLPNEEADLPELNKIAFKQKKISLGIVAGVVGYPLIENENSNPLLGGKLGATLKYQFKNRLSLNADLQYYYRQGEFFPVSRAEEVTYGFGRRTVATERTPEKLHYFELPIYLSYRLNPRHTIESGLSVNYLFAVRGNQEEITTSFNQRSAIDDPRPRWIDRTGFKKGFGSVLLGYNYNVSPSTTFGIRAVYTPTGFTEDMDSISQKVIQESTPLHLTFRLTQTLINF